ncbi:hypothetical protein B0H63DRAFT_95380 [Podospora didyma]|uniref:BHLH domain-containing protein n=1 Tax=Podospora didyma TaxID=330526 RepID=A0AAE0U3G5_9PEZI|nr:hypothetical protein B0H63DRAFT_95380 [Podospora didyma]
MMDTQVRVLGSDPLDLNLDVNETALSPMTPTYDYLDIGVDFAPWTSTFNYRPGPTYSPPAYLDEVASDYFSSAHDPLDFGDANYQPTFGINTGDWSKPSRPSRATFSATQRFPIMSSIPEGKIQCSPDAWAAETKTDSSIVVDAATANQESPEPLWSNNPTLRPIETSLPKPAGSRSRSVLLRTSSHKSRASRKASSRFSFSSVGSSPVTAKSSASDASEEAAPDHMTPEERRARKSHNIVEKQYRNRLNAHFERLLAALPAADRRPNGGGGRSGGMDVDHEGQTSSDDAAAAAEKRISKAEVLDLAMRYIQSLEQDRRRLERDKEQMLRNIDVMEAALERQDAISNAQQP